MNLTWAWCLEERMIMKISEIHLMTAVLCLTLVLGASLVLAGEEETRDGVLHIVNGVNSSHGLQTLVMEEAWRAGGEDGEDFFGLISQVLVGDDGNIYLLDTRLSEVPVYSSDGERLVTLSHEGEGPGETRNPSDMLMMPNGTLGLVQSFPGKVVTIDLEGNPTGDFKPTLDDGSFLSLKDCLANIDGQITVSGRTYKQESPTVGLQTHFVSNFDADGVEVVRMAQVENKMDFSNFDSSEDEQGEIGYRKVAVGPDGRIYIGKVRNQYSIEVFLPDGTLDRIIERQYTHRQRTDVEYNRVKTQSDAQVARLPGAKFEVSKIEPDISSLRFAGDGNLWVTSSRSGFEQPSGQMAVYDVFDADGHFIKEVAVKCIGDGMDDRLFWTPAGDAVLITGFNEALRALMAGGAGGAAPEEEEESEPMEVIYLKVSG